MVTATRRVAAQVRNMESDSGLQRVIPGVRGSLETDLNARWNADGTYVRLEGEVSANRFSVGSLHARRLRVDGSVFGQPSYPNAELTLRSKGLRIGAFRLGDLLATLRGTPSGYLVVARSEPAPQTQAEVRTKLRREEGAFIADSPKLSVKTPYGRWVGGALQAVLGPNGRLRVRRLAIHDEATHGRLSMDVDYQPKIALIGEGTLSDFDLRHLRPFLLAPGGLEAGG